MKWLIQWAVTSSVLVLTVLAVRFFCKDKLSARLKYALWLVALVRLLVPFQVELPARVSDSVPLVASNLVPEFDRWEEPSIPVFPQDTQTVAYFDTSFFDQLEPSEITKTDIGYFQRSEDGQTVTRYLDLWSSSQIALCVVWGGGVLMMLGGLLASNLHFALRLWRCGKRLAVPDVSVPVYVAEGLPSPCLFGLFRPAVYVTPDVAENPDTLRHVLAHELTHYAHFDHIWSLLRCLALAHHWYNPLAWIAVVLSKRDGELACDEGAIARLGEEERIPYGRTLVDMVAKRSARPTDLLSCSTAMTGGKKSIQQRVARLVKKPETVKTALFAAVAVVILSVVFVFAERSDFPGHSEKLDTYKDQLDSAQGVWFNAAMLHNSRVVTDSGQLDQLRELLALEPLTEEEKSWTWDGIWDQIISFTSVPPDADWTGGEECFYYVSYEENGQFYILLPTERDERPSSGAYVGRIPEGNWERTEEIYRNAPSVDDRKHWEQPGYAALNRFQAEVENAISIQYCPPPISSQIYPDPITDEELLALAKESLSRFVPQDLDTIVTGWYRRLISASRITLSDGKTETTYAFLQGQDGRTYLFSGDDYDALWSLGEDETMEVTPLGRTEQRSSVESSIANYARMQSERLRDPNYPVPMTYEELSRYTPKEIWESRGYQLQGWEGDLAEANFHYGLTALERVQLWYWGDETHRGVWVLELLAPGLSSSSTGYTIVSDQPREVFNAAQYAGEEFSYGMLGPSAFAAFLRPEDIITIGLSPSPMEQAENLDLQVLKDQLTQALYHQFSAEYDKEKYGLYELFILVDGEGLEAYGDFEIVGTAYRLALSIGSEPDTVCMRKPVSGMNNEELYTFVRSPELYQIIRNLFD